VQHPVSDELEYLMLHRSFETAGLDFRAIDRDDDVPEDALGTLDDAQLTGGDRVAHREREDVGRTIDLPVDDVQLPDELVTREHDREVAVHRSVVREDPLDQAPNAPPVDPDGLLLVYDVSRHRRSLAIARLALPLRTSRRPLLPRPDPGT